MLGFICLFGDSWAMKGCMLCTLPPLYIAAVPAVVAAAAAALAAVLRAELVSVCTLWLAFNSSLSTAHTEPPKLCLTLELIPLAVVHPQFLSTSARMPALRRHHI